MVSDGTRSSPLTARPAPILLASALEDASTSTVRILSVESRNWTLYLLFPPEGVVVLAAGALATLPFLTAWKPPLSNATISYSSTLYPFFLRNVFAFAVLLNALPFFLVIGASTVGVLLAAAAAGVVAAGVVAAGVVAAGVVAAAAAALFAVISLAAFSSSALIFSIWICCLRADSESLTKFLAASGCSFASSAIASSVITVLPSMS